VDSLRDEATLLLPLDVVVTGIGGESPVPGCDNLLAARELELGTAQGLCGHSSVVVLAADGQEDLADLHSGASASGPAKGSTHALLKPISSSARKHLVDTQDVEGVHAHAQVEGILAGKLDHVLVGSDTGSLQRLRGDILLLPGGKVDAVGEHVHIGPLHADIINADLGVGHTTAKTGLGVSLALRLTIATSRPSTHVNPLPSWSPA